MLSDNDIQDVTTNAVRARKLSWLGFKKDEQGEYVIPVLSPSDFQFAREIESAATAPLLARIAELDRSLDVMAKNTEAQAHASLQREIELTEKVEKMTLELEEARKAMELARSWIAERPDLRQCSAGKVVSELTHALAIDAATRRAIVRAATSIGQQKENHK